MKVTIYTARRGTENWVAWQFKEGKNVMQTIVPGEDLEVSLVFTSDNDHDWEFSYVDKNGAMIARTDQLMPKEWWPTNAKRILEERQQWTGPREG